MLNRKLQLQEGLKALTGLLDEFRRKIISNRNFERELLELHTRQLSEHWDQQFPGFPESRFPYSSDIGLLLRGRRDAYLKKIIIKLIATHKQRNGNEIIVNPACVIGRHTRDLASRLPNFKLIGTDIDPRWNQIYEHIHRKNNPDNFEFIKDNIFEPQVEVNPVAVVFFGACGSLTDGAIDYAIEMKSPYIMCRTCCHHIIGGNTQITHRLRFINWSFRILTWGLSRMRQKKKYIGFYFSDKYTKDSYPRSETARGISSSDEFLELCRNSADNDICRTIIDMDRYLFLAENRYDVWYKGELFVAEKQ
jgi:hypothetical protein